MLLKHLQDGRTRTLTAGQLERLMPRIGAIGPEEPHGICDLFELGDRTDVILEWRCMDGAMYACGSGNSPICGKMGLYDNLEEIKQFCRETPNDYPPAAITGRFPVNWVCKGGTPYIAGLESR
jgi:hypothetical protein